MRQWALRLSANGVFECEFDFPSDPGNESLAHFRLFRFLSSWHIFCASPTGSSLFTFTMLHSVSLRPCMSLPFYSWGSLRWRLFFSLSSSSAQGVLASADFRRRPTFPYPWCTARHVLHRQQCCETVGIGLFLVLVFLRPGVSLGFMSRLQCPKQHFPSTPLFIFGFALQRSLASRLDCPDSSEHQHVSRFG